MNRSSQRNLKCAGLALLAASTFICVAQSENDPTESPERATILALVETGDLEAAEQRARLALRKAETDHGPESGRMADALELLLTVLMRAAVQAQPETLELAKRLVTVREALSGSDHPDLVAALTIQSELYLRAREYVKAESVAERAVSLTPTAKGLDLLGTARFIQGDYASARPALERAIEIATADETSPGQLTLAKALGHLGAVLAETGHHDAARLNMERSLATLTRVHGPDHVEVAGGLDNLAGALNYAADYAAARRASEQALSIYTKLLGVSDPRTLRSRGNLAILLARMGEYAKARRVYEELIPLAKEHLGENHAGLAMILHSFANLLATLGDPDRADIFFERALDIRTRVFGPEHPLVALTLYNQGAVRREMQDHAGARAAAERALALYQSQDPDGPNTANALLLLGEVLEAAGNRDDAVLLFRKALSVQERAVGPDHWHVASALENLGRALMEMGRLEEAERLFARASSLYVTNLGSDHPHVGPLHKVIGSLLIRKGESSGAISEFLRAEEIGRDHLRLTTATLPEGLALRYAAVRGTGLGDALSIIATDPEIARTQGRRVWDSVIRSRAVVLDEMAARQRAVAKTGDLEVARLANRLQLATMRLANLFVQGAGDDADLHRQKLDEALRLKQQAEAALSEMSLPFRTKVAKRDAGFDEVARSLPVHSALVAFIRYEHSAPQTQSYLAFVLTADARSPAVVPLGDANSIERRIGAWSQETATPPSAVKAVARREETVQRESGEALRRVLWDPLRKHLGDAQRIFIVPDGALHLVSLAALPAEKRGYLVETGPSIHYLSAEKDLLRQHDHRTAEKGLLAIGGVDFDHTVATEDRGLMPTTTGGQENPFRSVAAACPELSSLRFEPLPDSRKEVREIGDLWAERSRGDTKEGSEMLTLTGGGANEEVAKRLAPHFAVLHLATHGFFAAPQCGSAQVDTATGKGARFVEDLPPLSAVGDNPLLLSGLALAGANARGSGGADQEDGMLTAEEVASLDLSAVEWAVLSGCETGIGDVRAGEGVLGLRRAFQIAGVDTVIMSLWRVRDQDTRDWMRELYTARLAGRSTIDAVQHASREVLDSRRKAGQSTHPFYWGAFVAAGGWE